MIPLDVWVGGSQGLGCLGPIKEKPQAVSSTEGIQSEASLREGTRHSRWGLALFQPQKANSTTQTLQMTLEQTERHTGDECLLLSESVPSGSPLSLLKTSAHGSTEETTAEVPTQQQTLGLTLTRHQAGQARTLVLSFCAHNNLWGKDHYHPHCHDQKQGSEC